MADDTGDKTEAPTPRRRAEAREQGNIARSQYLTLAMMLLGVLVTLNATGARLVTALKTLLHTMLSSESLSDFTANGATESMLQAVYAAAIALAPLLITAVIIAVVANVVQTGFNFTPARLQPNFAALNPTRGLGRIFSSRSPQQLGMSMIKMALLG